jgi:hypothetical protein
MFRGVLLLEQIIRTWPGKDIIMKIKRYKQARKVLEFYKRNFKFHEPFQVIGEPTNVLSCVVCVLQCM